MDITLNTYALFWEVQMLGLFIGHLQRQRKSHAGRTARRVPAPSIITTIHACFAVIYIDNTAPASVAATSQPEGE